MTKGTIAIREVKTNTAPLTLEDYSYREIGKRVASSYLQRKWDEEAEVSRWMWYAGYFFLGCFFWETLPILVGLARFFINL
jgi:hypothetical protein